jgi:hypothetical protein
MTVLFIYAVSDFVVSLKRVQYAVGAGGKKDEGIHSVQPAGDGTSPDG